MGETNLQMASHYLFYENDKAFHQDLMIDRNPDLIRKMIKSVLHAAKNNKPQANILEVTYRDHSTDDYIVRKANYKKFLTKNLEVMVEAEDYELCVQIRDTINKLK